MTDVLAPDESELASALADPEIADLRIAESTRRKRTHKEYFFTKVLPPLIVFAIAMGAWNLVSYVILSAPRQFLLPPPQEIVWVGILKWHNLKPILSALSLTARAAAIGFTISVVLGSTFAVLMSQAKWIERSLYPYAVILQTVPILALVPLIGFTLGFNFKSRVLICVMISIFPIITNMLFGVLSVDRGLHDLFSMQKVSRWTRLWRLQLPAALPAFFTGLRISAGLSVIGAVVGDFFFLQGAPGIGALINLYSSELLSDQLFASVIMASLLGLVAFSLVGIVSQRVLGPWHESALKED